MKKSLLQLAIVAVLGLTVVLAANLTNNENSDFIADSNSDAGEKVIICHIPPGNPDNAHTIEVSINALQAHMAHGDSLGSCDSGGGDSADDGNDNGNVGEEKTNNFGSPIDD